MPSLGCYVTMAVFKHQLRTHCDISHSCEVVQFQENQNHACLNTLFSVSYAGWRRVLIQQSPASSLKCEINEYYIILCTRSFVFHCRENQPKNLMHRDHFCNLHVLHADADLPLDHQRVHLFYLRNQTDTNLKFSPPPPYYYHSPPPPVKSPPPPYYYHSPPPVKSPPPPYYYHSPPPPVKSPPPPYYYHSPPPPVKSPPPPYYYHSPPPPVKSPPPPYYYSSPPPPKSYPPPYYYSSPPPPPKSYSPYYYSSPPPPVYKKYEKKRTQR
ncbi:hypothetical protein HID58_063210 [Brassica napus]|uniref:Uncharacterized protein n=1 Tax=Brassica napus TaxID=3708 RepID=A0ABQ8A3L5_BRANA|nr:hypothetical protein HID58_063210 [Brassica napus]